MPGLGARHFPLLNSLAAFFALIYWGLQSNWIQFKAECEHGKCMFHTGESFTSITTAIFYQVYGARFWYLQLLSLSPGEHGWSADLYQPDWVDRHFMIYTHNPNIGGFLVYGAALLGFQTVIVPAILTGIAYAAGIFLAFRFGETVTGNRMIGYWYGFFMATDFFYNLSYGLNLIRGWSWLGLFGVWYATARLLKGGGPWSVVLLVCGSVVTFLVGLDFDFLVISSALMLVLFTGVAWRVRARVALTIVLVSIAILGLRQVQVIGALGTDVWMTDIVYTAGLKIPYELRWYEIPDEAAITGWYDSHNLTRGYSAVFSIRVIVNWIFFWALLETWRPLQYIAPAFPLGVASIIILVAMRREVDVQALRAFVALTLGAALSGTVIFPHFTSYFIKLAFPHMTAIIFLGLAICVVSIWRLAALFNRRLALALMAVIVAVWSFQQVASVRTAAPEVYPHLVRIVPYGFWFCSPVQNPPIACS